MRTIIGDDKVTEEGVYRLEDIPIRFDKERVLRALDCFSDSPVYDEMSSIYEQCAKLVKELIEPTILFKIDKYTENVEGLKDYTYCVYSHIAVGTALTQKVADFFEEDEYLEGMILDALVTNSIFNMSELLYQQIYHYANTQNVGIKKLAIGEGEVPLQYQQYVYEQLSAYTPMGITGAFVIEPLQSLNSIYGLKEGLCLADRDHDCRQCKDKTCKWRIVNNAC